MNTNTKQKHKTIIFKICAMVLMFLAVSTMLVGCGKTEFTAASEFYYSSDQGSTMGYKLAKLLDTNQHKKF